MENDIIHKLIEARVKLSLKLLFEKRGLGPSNGNWKSFPKCPLCGGDYCAGLFSGSHGEKFKCHSPSCRSMTAGVGEAWDEIAFLSFELCCDRRAATRAWLEEAGVWENHLHSALELKSTISEPKPTSKDCSGETSDSAAEAPESPVDGAAKSPLRVFYEALTLSDADREELKSKRGLSDEAIDSGGFRTNCRANLELLHLLTQDFSEAELVRCGLWNSKEKHRKPSAQYYGYGTLGKKKKLTPELLNSGDYSDFDDDDFVWDWKESGQCNPILIPYFDVDGNLIGLRPHKGFPRGQQPRLYLAGDHNAIKQ